MHFAKRKIYRHRAHRKRGKHVAPPGATCCRELNYHVGMWNPMPGSRIDTQTTPGTTRSEMLTLVLEVRTPKSYRMLPLGGKDCISQSFKTPSLRSRHIFVDARLQLVKDHDAFVHRQQLQD